MCAFFMDSPSETSDTPRPLSEQVHSKRCPGPCQKCGQFNLLSKVHVTHNAYHHHGPLTSVSRMFHHQTTNQCNLFVAHRDFDSTLFLFFCDKSLVLRPRQRRQHDPLIILLLRYKLRLISVTAMLTTLVTTDKLLTGPSSEASNHVVLCRLWSVDVQTSALRVDLIWAKYISRGCTAMILSNLLKMRLAGAGNRLKLHYTITHLVVRHVVSPLGSNSSNHGNVASLHHLIMCDCRVHSPT